MVIRHYLSSHTVKTPLDNIPLTTEFLNLMAEIVLFPARPWTVEAMARASGLSRSWFIQRFNQVRRCHLQKLCAIFALHWPASTSPAV